MDILFDAKKIMTALVLPPTGPLLLAVLGVIMLRKWSRVGHSLVWIGILLLLVLSLPVTSSLLMTVASTGASFSAAAGGQAEAIVILGGGQRYAPEYGGATVSEPSLERIRYGAKLAGELNLPILVTGGAVYGDVSEAHLMAQALRHSFSTSVQWIEDRSRDTHENARFSSAILHRAGIRTIVLVTHDFHQRRSIAEFSAVGIQPIPASVTTVSPRRDRKLPEHFPNADALRRSSVALRELLAYLVLAPKNKAEEVVR